MRRRSKERTSNNNNNNNNNNDNNNEFISAHPFYLKLGLRSKIIYTKKKYCIIRP